MWRTIATLFVCLLVVVLAIGIVFFVGMRTKSPLVQQHRSPIQPGVGEPAPDEDGRDAGGVRIGDPTRRPEDGTLVRNAGGALRDPRRVRDRAALRAGYGLDQERARNGVRHHRQRRGNVVDRPAGARSQPWPRPICRRRSNGHFAGSPSTGASGFTAWNQTTAIRTRRGGTRSRGKWSSPRESGP